MPWSIEKRGDEYCVVKDDDGDVEGCHDTREKAIKQQRALYASEGEAAIERSGTEAAAALSALFGSSTTASGGTVTEMSTTGSGNFSTSTTSANGGPMMIEVSEELLDVLKMVQMSPSPDVPAEPGPLSDEWEGPLAIIGHPTSDGRFLLPGEISHRDLPLPLMVQTKTSEGHDGAEVAGRIDKVEFVPKAEFERLEEFGLNDLPDGATVVWGEGIFDGSPAADEAKRLIANGSGVSIDIPLDRMALVDPDTFEEVNEADVPLDDILTGKYLTGLGGKIAGATVVTIGAFEEATVQLVDGVALVASAGVQFKSTPIALADVVNSEDIGILIASAAPLKPPREWFEDPGLAKLTPLTITDDGRIFGHLADWDGCHTGFTNICVPPFQSESNFAYFNVGEIVCADGAKMPVGKLMFSREMPNGHASTDPKVGVREAQRYYDKSTNIAGFVRAGADRFGTWLAGCLRTDLPEEDLQIVRANPPSGDWRPIPGKGSELVAAFCVPVPGFPIPRSLVASAGDGLTIITGPLQVNLSERARMRRMAMLRALRAA